MATKHLKVSVTISSVNVQSTAQTPPFKYHDMKLLKSHSATWQSIQEHPNHKVQCIYPGSPETSSVEAKTFKRDIGC